MYLNLQQVQHHMWVFEWPHLLKRDCPVARPLLKTPERSCSGRRRYRAVRQRTMRWFVLRRGCCFLPGTDARLRHLCGSSVNGRCVWRHCTARRPSHLLATVGALLASFRFLPGSARSHIVKFANCSFLALLLLLLFSFKFYIITIFDYFFILYYN